LNSFPSRILQRYRPAGAGASWTAVASAARHRFRTHETGWSFNHHRPPESAVAAPALPSHSKMPPSFEPSIDYVVTKIPRFAFEVLAHGHLSARSLQTATITLTTQMKSVGEAMAIGRTFKKSLQKCLRSPRSAAFTPLHLTHTSTPRNFPTPSPIRTLKRPEGRAPQSERAVHGASAFANPARPIFRESSALRTLKRHKCRASMRCAATAGVRIRRDGKRCTTANHARPLPEMLSRDFARCNGWRVSSAPHRG